MEIRGDRGDTHFPSGNEAPPTAISDPEEAVLLWPTRVDPLYRPRDLVTVAFQLSYGFLRIAITYLGIEPCLAILQAGLL